MRRNDRRTLSPCWLLVAATLLPWGCGGGGGGGGGGDNPGDQPPPPAQWSSHALRQVNAGGLTTPQLDTVVDAAGLAHLFFFEDTVDPALPPYTIRHLTIAPEDAGTVAPTEASVVQVDNCSGLSSALITSTGPLVLYQGGVTRDCGSNQQSDAMLSLSDGTQWQEYTAAIGEVERNPVFFDGLAGTSMATATDNTGRIHAVFQFYYEGCDAMNFAYPDLRYVSASTGELDPVDGLTEETVEGNDYDGTNEQNRVGDQVCIAIDGTDQPVVFYSAELADGTEGLRVARREAGGWVREWVETDCEVGRMSCAVSPADGVVRVAYQVTRYTDGRDDIDCLRYAEPGAGGWETTMVDDRSRCGHGCSLAFAANGDPAIAYRSALSHTNRPLDDLKLASRTQGIWDTDEVATAGDLGHYNRLWIDGERTFIATYSQAQHMIYLLSR